jgi:hypothetical protein
MALSPLSLFQLFYCLIHISFRYEKISPNIFSVGDIVEARIVFMVVPTVPPIRGATEPHSFISLGSDSFTL